MNETTEAILRHASDAVRFVRGYYMSESGRLGAAEAVAGEAFRSRQAWGASLVEDACRVTGLERSGVGLASEANVRSAIVEVLRDGATEDLRLWLAMTLVSVRLSVGFVAEPWLDRAIGRRPAFGIVNV